MRKKGVCCVEQSIEELKQRLFEATRRFITRHRDEGDSRGVTVRLTELGWKYEQMNRRMHDRRLEELLEFLGEDDAREFARIAERLSDFESTHPWSAYVEGPRELKGDSARKEPSQEAFAGSSSGEGGERCE